MIEPVDMEVLRNEDDYIESHNSCKDTDKELGEN